MKKFQVLALSSFVAIGTLLTSCGGNISTNAPLKTDVDTLSYAFAAKLYSEGLESHLMQMGLLADTASVQYQYKQLIEADATGSKKAELEKTMRFKIDSIKKANERSIAEFLKGMKSTINAPESQKAFLLGQTIGTQIGGTMLPQMAERLYGENSGKKLNTDVFIASIATSLKKGKHAIANPDIIFSVKMQEIQEKEMKAREEEMKKEYAPKIEEGQNFLADNKTKEGVVTLPSGLQYKVIKEGNGAKPTASDVVNVHYHGTLIDGTVFDSSVQRGEPATFGVGQVIPGWTEILQLMPAGSKWTVYIPYELGYGAQSAGSIPPFSTLVFDVELLSIEGK